jgi:predicted kinase
MDLEHHGRADLAWHLVAAYGRASGDPGLAAVLDFYTAYRAIVRGKVESFRSQQPDVEPAERTAAATAARQYFDLAFAHAGGVARPALVITCGLMGTGKTTLAGALAGRLGLVQLSADLTRKRLAGLAPGEHRYEAFGAGIYRPAFTARTYAALLTEAHTWLRRGCSVVVDASFKRAGERARARGLAAALDVPLVVIECVCPEAVAHERLQTRLAAADSASDGRWALFAQQRADFDPCHELAPGEHLVIDTTAPPDAGADRVRDHLTAQAALRLHETVASSAGGAERPAAALATP